MAARATGRDVAMAQERAKGSVTAQGSTTEAEAEEAARAVARVAARARATVEAAAEAMGREVARATVRAAEEEELVGAA